MPIKAMRFLDIKCEKTVDYNDNKYIVDFLPFCILNPLDIYITLALIFVVTIRLVDRLAHYVACAGGQAGVGGSNIIASNFRAAMNIRIIKL